MVLGPHTPLFLLINFSHFHTQATCQAFLSLPDSVAQRKGAYGQPDL